MARLLLARSLRRLAAPGSPVERALRAIATGSVAAVFAIAQRLAPEEASAFGGALVDHLGPRFRKHRLVDGNLAIAFPDRGTAWRRATARGIWRNVGRTFGEYPHIPRITGRALADRFAFRATFPLSEIRSSRRRFVRVHDTVRRGLAGLAAGRSQGLFGDHRIHPGEPVRFFGHPAPTTIVPARLADRVDTALVQIRLERREGVRFRLTLEDPVPPDGALRDPRDRAVEMMERVHRAFECWVRGRPEEWFCVKRRWPKPLLCAADAGVAATRVAGAGA